MSFLSLVGSQRPESLNANAVSFIESSLEALGAQTERSGWMRLDLPIYSQVIESEEGLPKAVDHLRTRINKAEGIIIGCPEYNGFMPPLLLNALTWATRGKHGQPDLAPFRLKPCLICASSPGSLGGIRAAGHLATYLLGIGATVFPDFFLIPNAATISASGNDSESLRLRTRADAIAADFLSQARRQSQ